MSNEHYDLEVEPLIKSYQLLGDSQFVRFAEQLLGQKRKYRDGFAYIGLCVSGQKINDLLNRVRDNFHPITPKIVLMIGTNDILRNTGLKDMCDTLNTLVSELLDRRVDKIIVLTIPPVPRLANSKRHWERLYGYNEYIKSLDNGYDILTLDICPLFVTRMDNLDESGGDDSYSSERSRSRNNSNAESDNEISASDNQTSSHQSSGMRNIILSSSPYFRGSSVECRSAGTSSKTDDVSPTPSYKNLRISIGVKRKVVEVDDSDCSDLLSSSDRSSPSSKRRHCSSNLAIDDHDDSFCADDSYTEDRPKYHIKNDYFEEYFSGNRRQDLIHLNRKGLSLVKYELYRLIGG